MKSVDTLDPAEGIIFDGVPAASADLIDLLDRVLPHLCITQGQTEAEARYYSAQRDLVDYLMSILEQQNSEDNEATRESVIKTIKR